MIMRLFVTTLIVIGIGSCRLGPNSNNVGIDCSNAQDCDDDALGCVSTKDDNPNVGVGNADGICLPPPEGWTCPGDFWNDDEEFCDCGCGVVDGDCGGDETGVACDEDNCPSGEDPDPLDNSQCL